MKNGLLTAGELFLSRAAHALEHHPKHVTALIAALLLGGGGGAFAVASLAPEPADVTVREVLEAVNPMPLQSQVDALDVHSFNLFRTDSTRASDTVEALLARLGVDDPKAAAYLRTEPTFRTQVLGRAGRGVTAEATADQSLDKLSVRWSPADDGTFKRLVIERQPQGQFISRVETAPLVAATRMGSATILARMADLLTARLIRCWVKSHNSDTSGWLAAIRDPHIGRALAAEYSAPPEEVEAMHQAWFKAVTLTATPATGSRSPPPAWSSTRPWPDSSPSIRARAASSSSTTSGECPSLRSRARWSCRPTCRWRW